ncbi:hypothetical protein [Burkholderia cepacia]|uniref:hypothetical protein n=1 Tax=Burkholderia cepacia TaxID=292 RepID=UPI002AB61FE4|nr:hypothetical protein [Burkholderia cepacia]
MSHTAASPWMLAGVDTYQRHAHMTPVPANRRQSLAHETTDSPARFAAAASKAPVVDTYQRIGRRGIAKSTPADMSLSQHGITNRSAHVDTHQHPVFSRDVLGRLPIIHRACKDNRAARNFAPWLAIPTLVDTYQRLRFLRNFRF